jgi:hypothetical protein
VGIINYQDCEANDMQQSAGRREEVHQTSFEEGVKVGSLGEIILLIGRCIESKMLPQHEDETRHEEEQMFW